MIEEYQYGFGVQYFDRDFAKQCRSTQSLLNKKIFEVHKQNSYNSDFNYLYNGDKNRNGIEIYIYDIKLNKRSSTCEIESCKPNGCLLDYITSYLKISNSHLFIIGSYKYDYKNFLIDLKTKAISEMPNFKDQLDVSNNYNQFIYYDNHLFVFGSFASSGLLKYNINQNKWQGMNFPRLDRRIFSVLFHNYVLISCFWNSSFYLYDLLIEAHSEIAFYECTASSKFLFTYQARVYLWIQIGLIYESDINNPFKWNIIGNNNFGIRASPYDITFSNFEGNLYASFIEKPQMFCYKFNREKKEMELIYQEEVNR